MLIDVLINCISTPDVNNKKEDELGKVFSEFPNSLSNLCKQKYKIVTN